jgi:hypothetical protein
MGRWDFKKELTTPGAPASGYSSIYPKDDDQWYFQNSNGVETRFETSLGTLQDKVRYVGKHGNDSNTGQSLEDAFLTFGQAITACIAQAPSSSDPYSIVCLDGGIYSESLTMAPFISIFAPGATLFGNQILTDNSSITVNLINGTSGTLISKISGVSTGLFRCSAIVLLGSANGIFCSSGSLSIQTDTISNNSSGFAIGGASTAEIKAHFNSMGIGAGGIGVDSAGSGEIIVICGEIYETVPGSTGLRATSSGHIHATISHLHCTTAVNVSSISTVTLIASSLTGVETVAGGGVYEVTKAGESFADPMTSRGDIIYRDSSNATARLGLGSTNQALRSNGNDLVWASVGDGDVSKVGTPADDQVGVWTGDGTLEGGSDLTFDGSNLSVAGGLVVDGDLDGVNAIKFNLLAAATGGVGIFNWNAAEGTVDLGLAGGIVRVQIGQESVVPVRNITGVEIPNGSVVYVTGSDSGFLTVDLADNTDPDKIKALGFITATLPHNENGFVTGFGTVRGNVAEPINTAAYIPGTKLYLGTAGGWTNIHPTDPAHAAIVVGVVRIQNATDGEITVHFNYYSNGNNFNGILRSSLINKNAGVAAGSSITAVNDLGYWASITMGSSNFALAPNAASFFNIGYADTFYTVDGNKSHKFINDPTDSHDYSSINYLNMEIKADGEVVLPRGQLTSQIATGTAPLNVTSETINPNLNADMLDGVHAVELLSSSPWNGTFKEPFDARVTSNGTAITMSLEKSGTGDLTMQFSDGIAILDCTDPVQTIALTAGSSSSPQSNYIYIPQSTKVLTKSTTNWPSTEHIKIGYFYCQSASIVQSDGPLINQNWNDELAGGDNQGHITHIGQWIRSVGAKWFSGCSGGGSSGYITPYAGGGTIQVNAGVISQMHKHIFTAIDTNTTGSANVVNYPSDSFKSITDLNEMLLDSISGSLTNRYYNIILAGVANKSGEFSPLLINLPAGSYNSSAGAIADSSNYDDYSLPREFTKESSTAFLIARITLRNQGDTTFTVMNTQDLRGMDSAVSGGSLGGAAVSDFSDSQFSVYNNADPTKIIAMDASGISAGNTRTVSAADADMAIPTTTQTANMITASSVVSDNAIITGDGGSRGVQGSPVTMDDSGRIQNVENLGFAATHDNGNSGSAFNLTLSNGQLQKVTLDSNSVAMTIVDTGNIGDGEWRITVKQDTTGGRSITSASVSGGTVRTESGAAPTFSSGVSAEDTMIIIKEGTTYSIQVIATNWQTWT